MWLECMFLVTEVDDLRPDINMLCPQARQFICIASVDSAAKCVPSGYNLLKAVQCYELFRGIALKNHTFFTDIFKIKALLRPFRTPIMLHIYHY